MKMTTRMFLIFIVMLTANLATLAQNQEAAALAYKNWKSRATSNTDKSAAYKFQGVGVAVEKYQDGSVKVNFAVGMSLDIKELGAVTFTVQPIITGTENNKSFVKETGKPSKLGSAGVDRSDNENGEIVLTPQIIAPVPPDANAIKVVVIGLDSASQSGYTIILPLNSKANSAALGKVF